MGHRERKRGITMSLDQFNRSNPIEDWIRKGAAITAQETAKAAARQSIEDAEAVARLKEESLVDHDHLKLLGMKAIDLTIVSTNQRNKKDESKKQAQLNAQREEYAARYRVWKKNRDSQIELLTKKNLLTQKNIQTLTPTAAKSGMFGGSKKNVDPTLADEWVSIDKPGLK